MLEMTGKRFKTCKKKKTLEIVAERLHVPLVRCTRQYGNLRVAYKAAQSPALGTSTSAPVPGMAGGQNRAEGEELVVERIRADLSISRALAFDYAKSAFLVVHKFDIGRSSLANLKYKHYDAMSLALIRWCPGGDSDPMATQELQLERSVCTLLSLSLSLSLTVTHCHSLSLNCTLTVIHCHTHTPPRFITTSHVQHLTFPLAQRLSVTISL